MIQLTDTTWQSDNGLITFIQGDCNLFMAGCKENEFELAVVDPPYGIDAGKMTMGSGNHKFTKGKEWDSGIPTAEYFEQLFRVSKNQIIWGGNYFTEHLKPSPHWLIWDKKTLIYHLLKEKWLGLIKAKI